jgi:uncharacterized protein (DUF305 family)
MMVHHAQAVRMAEAVRDRTEDPAIRVLATEVILTQQAEIGQMQGWLEVWGVAANSPEPPMAWMGHAQEENEPMPGMASPENLSVLYQSSGEEADEQFLRLMIPHHEAAVAMGEAALQRADRPEVRRLAEKTAISQRAEVRAMQALLQRKGLDAEPGAPEDLTLKDHEDHGPHAHLTDALRDAARLGPLPLAVLAAAWLLLDTARRRTRDGEPVPAPGRFFSKSLAVGGLLLSAVLHVGLAPAHFEEAASHGVFFAVSGVALAVAAAAVLAWPSPPVYLTGAALPLALVVLWAIFRVVPPPSAAVPEAVDAAGLLTKAAELVAVAACIALWRGSERSGKGNDAP